MQAEDTRWLGLQQSSSTKGISIFSSFPNLNSYRIMWIMPEGMSGMFVSPQNSKFEILIPVGMVFRGGAFGKKLGFNKVVRAEPTLWDWCPCKKRKKPELCSSLLGKDRAKRQLSVNQEEHPQQILNLLVPLSWSSQPIELWEINVCYLSYSVYSIFLIAAQPDKDTSTREKLQA